MSDTTITSRQVRDGTLIRADINTTITGSALITKVLAGDAINLSSSGIDEGTGDVTINVTGAVPLSTTNFDKILSPSEDTVQKAFDVIDDLKHSDLDELNADDHSQYILVAGTRAFTGDQSLGGNKITNLGNPTNANDGVNKSYVDSKVQGLDWQESVLDKDLTSPPGSPSSGDRYIVGVGATGDWSGYDNYIAEYTTSWSFINPDQGFSTWVEDEDKLYVYDGSTWIKFGSTISHDTLIGLLDDDHTQYLRTDGTRQLTGNWDIGDGRIILGDEIRARSTSGLKLTENSGLGINIQNTTGNIGLGISSPNYRLHLHKTDSSQNYIQFTNSTTGSGSANGFLIGFDASEIGKIWHSENKPIEFGTNALLRMTIAADGTIGIGRAPSYTLDINGTLNLQTGTSINEFSIDGTLAGNSDDAVPTEKAVKTYADGIIPTQTGNDGKFLSTNGSVLSWEDVDAFPDQTGNDGKFLSTNGTSVSWETVDALPDQTGHAGKVLTTDGTDANWEDIVAGTKEKQIEVWNPDHEDTGVEIGNVWNMAESLRFSSFEDGAVWSSFRLPDTFDTTADIEFKIDYTMSSTSTGNIELELKAWCVRDGETPDEEYADSTGVIIFTANNGNSLEFKELPNCYIPGGYITDHNLRIIIKLTRKTSTPSNHNGWLEILGFIAYQDR